LRTENELTAANVAVGSIYLTLQNILSTLIGVLGYAYLSRAVTQEEMGAIAGVTLLYSLVQTVVDLGINSSIAKFVSEDIGKGIDPSKHVVSALTLRLPLTLAAASSIAIFSQNISEVLFKTAAYSNILTLIAIDAVLLSISPLLNNVLLGCGKLKSIAVYGISSTAARWLFITLFLLNGYGLNGVIYGWIIGDAALLVMFALSTIKRTNLRRSMLNESVRLLPQMLRFSMPIYISAIISFLCTWYDKALILAFLPLEQLGIYNVAYTAFSVLVSIAASLGSALLPYYGMAYGKNNHKAISEAIKRAGKYIMLTMFPLALGLAATAKPVITLFAAQQYEAGWPVLATLALFGLVYGFSPAFSNLLLIYGKTKTILLVNLTSVALSLTMLPTLQFLGLTGLATVRGASLLLSFALSVYFISKAVKIEIDGQTAWKALASATIMTIAVLAAQQPLQNNHFLLLYVAIGSATYITLIRILKILNKEDEQLIKEIAGEKSAKIITKTLGIK
jgi:O-antigen/teichoic acid export membrane protein